MEIPDEVLRKYCEAAVALRVAAITAALETLRSEVAASPSLGVERADAVINALESAKRTLEAALPPR